MGKLVTAEAVAAGHPDKVADAISDAIVDAHLLLADDARVGVETLITRGRVVVAGEAAGPRPDYHDLIRSTLTRLGYNPADFDIATHIHHQSKSISKGVSGGGAGDQGVMYGYASADEGNPGCIPAAAYYSNRLMENLLWEREGGGDPLFWGLGPDGKCQLTLEYREGVPHHLHTACFSFHTPDNTTQNQMQLQELALKLLHRTLPMLWLDRNTRVLVDSFSSGGPGADTGCTGRKLMVDAYGAGYPSGGGAFSGKDPTKVDRSAAYGARYWALNVVAAGLARKCCVNVSYRLGDAAPLEFDINCFGTAILPEPRIRDALQKLAPLAPEGIRSSLGLNAPIYSATAAFGHFGRRPRHQLFPWEKQDLVAGLEELLGQKSGLEASGTESPD